MSLQLKLIIPLINKDITLDDISNEIGFVGAYTLDINKPYLTNHIFLLYERTMNPKSLEVRKKLSEFNNFYNKRNIKIKDKLYVLYCFTINKDIKLVKTNCILILSPNVKLQIYKFWNFTDTDITDFMLGYAYLGDEFKDSIVPEEDYSPKDFIDYDEKREVLTISTSL